MKNFIHVGLLSREEVVTAVVESLRMIPYYCRRQSPPLTPSLLALRRAKQLQPKTVFWFEEMSTRTRHSFGEAAELVGFRVGSAITAADSSLGKGEPAGLTLRMLIQQGADIVVVRSKTEGLGMHLAQCIQRTPPDENWVRQDVSIIVGGAGTRDHPSQVLLDIVTIVAQRLGIRKLSQYNELEALFRRSDAKRYLADRVVEILSSLKIAFVGDLLHSRVVHDWIKLGQLFDVQFIFVAPPVFQVEAFCRAKIKCAVVNDLNSAQEADVTYTIRTQLERLKQMMSPHEAAAAAKALMITSEFVDRYRGFIMDAQPIDGHAPTIEPGLWVHPKNLMLMESSIGIPTRTAILQLCEAGRHTEVTPLLEEPRVRPAILQEGDLADHRRKLDAKYHDRDLFFTYVQNGTVIDRLRPGTASLVRRLCQKAGLLRGPQRQITIGEGVDSGALPGGKEIIQLHNRWPSFQLAAVIGIVAPEVRFSFMRVDDEKEYRRLDFPLPKAVAKLLVCPNPDCVTNSDPEAETFFSVSGQKEQPSDIGLECAYCQQHFDTSAIVAALDR